VQYGATHVQGTINGYGERCGNADLVSIIPNLQLKLGLDCVTDDQLRSLAATAHFLAELLNLTPDPYQPYVGRNAFAHKGGLHVAGVAADPATFEHLDPALVGNRPDLLTSELSGRRTVSERAKDAGIELSDHDAHEVVQRVKELERRGYHFEAADGSFELLLRKQAGSYEPLFRLESWRAIVEKRADGRVETEATIKVWVVRILDEAKGIGAVTRVLLDASDGEEVWGSIGVSENVIEASWEALVDSIEYGMQERQEPQLDRRGAGSMTSRGS
jgi:2-isopropylmalate synthase